MTKFLLAQTVLNDREDVIVVSPDKLSKMIEEKAHAEVSILLRVIAEMEAVLNDGHLTDRDVCSMLESGIQAFRKGLLRTPWFNEYHELWKAARDSRTHEQREPEAPEDEQPDN